LLVHVHARTGEATATTLELGLDAIQYADVAALEADRFLLVYNGDEPDTGPPATFSRVLEVAPR
jgi:hypothetical protein